MTRRERERLEDIRLAIEAISAHMQRGGLEDDLVFDAVRVRLIEIGEAVKAVPDDLRNREPEIPWSGIAGIRDILTHQYFRIERSIVEATVEKDLPALLSASMRLLRSFDDED